MNARGYQITVLLMAANVALTQHVLKAHRMVVWMENVCAEERMNARRDSRVGKGLVLVRCNLYSICLIKSQIVDISYKILSMYLFEKNFQGI